MGSRPHRIDYEHAYHHVMTRGTDQWNIFLDDRDRGEFVTLLARGHRRYATAVLAYCLMGNHVHLVLYCPQGNLAASMRDLKSMYAGYFNERHGRTGPLFEGRYVNKLISSDAYLLTAIRYVHRNPLELYPDTPLADYPWSSHAAYLGLRTTTPWLDVRTARQRFGSDYRSIVEQPQPTDVVQNCPTKGQAKSAAPGAALLADRSGEVSLSQIILAISAAANCSPCAIQPRARNGLMGIAVVLAMDVAKRASSEIAEPFGFRSAGSVRRLATTTRQRLETDPATARLWNEAQCHLAASTGFAPPG